MARKDKDIEKEVQDIIKNLNWLMEPHDSYVELIGIRGKRVIISASGPCTECEKDCIGTAFRERLPHIRLVIEKTLN